MVWHGVAWCGVVWRGVCFLVLRSLLLSLVAVERHMIFDYNVNASMAAAAGWQAEKEMENAEYYLAACFAFV